MTDYPEWFENLWKKYPKRAGGNPKRSAYKKLCARIKQGYQLSDIEAGLIRYAAFCQKTAKNGSEFVMQAQRFFGPDENWAESWDLPVEPVKKETVEEKARRLGIQPRIGETMFDFQRRVTQHQG